MEVNAQKSSISFNGILRAQESAIKEVLPFLEIVLNKVLKYLGFCLKTNNYGHHDWMWLYTKIDKRITVWWNRLDTLVKSILEAISVYWHGLTYILNGIQKKIRKQCFKFLWNGKGEKNPFSTSKMETYCKTQRFWGPWIKCKFFKSRWLLS